MKRQMQEMQVSSGTGLLDLEHSTRCRQLSSDFDTSANVRSDRIPGHNRVCRIVKIAVGWRRRASRSKTQMSFTSFYPRHLSVTKRRRCRDISLPVSPTLRCSPYHHPPPPAHPYLEPSLTTHPCRGTRVSPYPTVPEPPLSPLQTEQDPLRSS